MVKKNILIFLGFTSLVLGIIGITVPLLPTTPFLLLSAYLFSKSSERWHSFIINNKVFGKYIRDYQEKKGITLKNKISAILFLFLSIGYSMLKVESLHLRIFLGIVFISVSFHILKLRTLR
ncbi:YbaN family protein [Fusobacterium sp.]|uniref:YbaN family protein n=1 Tax=Fusobacterium sp. TaxID=68766 RepID=UPI0026255A41|nr:YbaN family protein [Fusobacterium sp.]